MLIHKDALAVTEAVTAEKTRYFLSGAMFDKQGRAVATNGHVLVRFASNPINADDFPKLANGLDVNAAADVIVDAGDLKAAATTMAKRSNIVALNYMAIVPNGTHVTLAATDLSKDVQIRGKNIEGAFPAYEKILTVAAPVLAKIVLSPEVIEVVARVARKVGVKALYLTIHGEAGIGSEKPVLFTGKGENGTLDGALMPMRS